MARGWESKAVESQQQDADAARQRGPDLPPAERERLQQRRTIELAMAQTQAELGAACRAPHRDMLRQKLAALDRALGDLA
jgi:hypothetical protein